MNGKQLWKNSDMNGCLGFQLAILVGVSKTPSLLALTAEETSGQ